MTHDPLQDLLARADRAWEGRSDHSAGELVAAVRRRARRQAVRRRAGAVATGVLAIGAWGCWQLTRDIPPRDVAQQLASGPTGALPPVATGEASRAMSLEELNRAAQQAQRIAEGWARAAEIPAARAAASTAPEPWDDSPSRRVEQIAERTAIISLVHAQRLERELARPDAARAQFESIVRYFPDTQSAQHARQWLDRHQAPMADPTDSHMN